VLGKRGRDEYSGGEMVCGERGATLLLWGLLRTENFSKTEKCNFGNKSIMEGILYYMVPIMGNSVSNFSF